MRLFAAKIILAALAASAMPSGLVAQSRVKLGVLECRGGPSVGLIVGSSTQLSCVYTGDDRFQDRYIAIVQKIGLDIGITDSTAIAWTVFAPTNRIGAGDLSGNYGGVSGSAAVGVGVGANALIGGSNNSVALQPLSLQGQIGLSVQAGLQGLELRPAR